MLPISRIWEKTQAVSLSGLKLARLAIARCSHCGQGAFSPLRAHSSAPLRFSIAVPRPWLDMPHLARFFPLGFLTPLSERTLEWITMSV